MVGYLSLRVVLDRLLRNPLLRDLDFERVVDDCVDFLEILGIPVTFVDRFYEGNLDDYRLELPCDIGYIEQVLIDDAVARDATDSFHVHYGCMCIDNHPFSFKSRDATFTVQDGYLFSSIKRCNVKIAYKGIKCDADGYPMIPDHRSFINALEKYVENKYLRIAWQNGRVTDKVYDDSRQEYSWAVGQCETALRGLSLGKMENLLNMWKSLLVNDNHFSTRFKDLGRRELIKKH